MFDLKKTNKKGPSTRGKLSIVTLMEEVHFVVLEEENFEDR